jgi:hypothetical protein
VIAELNAFARTLRQFPKRLAALLLLPALSWHGTVVRMRLGQCAGSSGRRRGLAGREGKDASESPVSPTS